MKMLLTAKRMARRNLKAQQKRNPRRKPNHRIEKKVKGRRTKKRPRLVLMRSEKQKMKTKVSLLMEMNRRPNVGAASPELRLILKSIYYIMSYLLFIFQLIIILLLREDCGRLPPHVDVQIGDKLKVYYGPMQDSKVTYEAKVSQIFLVFILAF